jgi:hypothetical protein
LRDKSVALEHLFRVTHRDDFQCDVFRRAVRLMPLADAVATAFIAPALRHADVGGRSWVSTVGPRRWAAVAVGLLGVIVMTRPGAGVIQPAAILGADLGLSAMRAAI